MTHQMESTSSGSPDLYDSGGATYNLLLALYRSMVQIRSVELGIERAHRAAKISGSFHSSMGQESCAAGICAALRPRDIVTSNHRGHGHALAKGVSANAVMGELFKKTHGTSGGRGASMHLHDRASGFYGETAIVGGGLPWAAGAAWARRRTGTDDIAVAFAGDGAFANGLYLETLRTAQYWGAPCLFVCENNGWAHSMQVEKVYGPPGSISKIVAATGMKSIYVDGRDVKAVYDAAAELVHYVRQGVPAFLECGVYRVRGHSLNDADYRYRPKTDGSDWLHENDPIAALRTKLALSDAELIEQSVALEVERALELAEAGESPTPVDAFRGVYATEGLDWNGEI